MKIVHFEMNQETRTCTGCPERGPQLLRNFYVNRARRNGRTARCMECLKAERHAYQERVRASKPPKVERKRCQPAFPVWRLRLKPKDAVHLAIQRGAKDQRTIKDSTHLHEDQICDALAELWADDKLNREALKRREYRIAA